MDKSIRGHIWLVPGWLQSFARPVRDSDLAVRYLSSGANVDADGQELLKLQERVVAAADVQQADLPLQRQMSATHRYTMVIVRSQRRGS